MATTHGSSIIRAIRIARRSPIGSASSSTPRNRSRPERSWSTTINTSAVTTTRKRTRRSTAADVALQNVAGLSWRRRQPEMAGQPAATIVALMRGLVDYAGLFPPAALQMPEAVSNYAAYVSSRDGWMLGSFVLGADRLDELSEATQSLDLLSAPWRLSALVGPDVH